jgi:hypothetical protein
MHEISKPLELVIRQTAPKAVVTPLTDNTDSPSRKKSN